MANATRTGHTKRQIVESAAEALIQDQGFDSILLETDQAVADFNAQYGTEIEKISDLDSKTFRQAVGASGIVVIPEGSGIRISRMTAVAQATASAPVSAPAPQAQQSAQATASTPAPKGGKFQPKTPDGKDFYFDPATDKFAYSAFAGKMVEENGVRRFTNPKAVLLVGETGCGKTTRCSIYHDALKQGTGRDIPLYFIDFSAGTDESEFLGHREVRAENGVSVTEFVYGVLPEAMGVNGKAGTLIINELDHAPGGVLTKLHEVLQTRRLVLGDNNGEVVTANEDFRIIATANTAGRGDTTGQYAHTNILNAALIDRFLTFEIPYPPEEWKIYAAHVGDKVAKKIEKFAGAVRNAIRVGELQMTMSIRRLEFLAEYIPQWGLQAAFAHTILSGLDEDEKVVLREMAQKVFGEEL